VKPLESVTRGVYKQLEPGQVLEGLYAKNKFEKSILVKMVNGSLSAFPLIHTCLIVSKKPLPVKANGEWGAFKRFPEKEDRPVPVWYVENKDILFHINSGNAGVANNAVSMNIQADALFFYFWTHNMKGKSLFGSGGKLDFHGNLTVHYEEAVKPKE